MRNKASITLTLLASLVLVVVAAPAEAGTCSQTAAAGNWAYTYTGTIFTPNGPLPAASVGHFHQDQAGNLSGTQSRSVAGASGSEDISGTLTVHSNCTVSATIQVYVNGQLQRTAGLAGSYDSNGKHARLIFQSLTLPNGANVPVVIAIDGNKVAYGN